MEYEGRSSRAGFRATGHDADTRPGGALRPADHPSQPTPLRRGPLRVAGGETQRAVMAAENQTYYKTLQIPKDADEREIKKAYHRMAREYHPDKATTPEQVKEFEEKFGLISTAYNTLKDAASRAEYDRRTFGSTTPEAEKAEARRRSAENPENAGEVPAAVPKPQTVQQVTKARKEAEQAPASGGFGQEVDAKRQEIAKKAFVRGLKLLKDKDHAKAAEFFEAAIANNPNEAQYHARLAATLIEAKKSVTRAIEAGEKAIELDRYNLDYKFNLAHIYQTIGSESRAREMYEDILKWDENNEMAAQMLRDMKRVNSKMYQFKKKRAELRAKFIKPGGTMDKILIEITKKR